MKAYITGVEGIALTGDERRLLADSPPFGLILFQRNCVSPDQIKALIDEMKDLLGVETLPVLIDQEGGRVQRLKPPHWRAYPPGERYADLYAIDREKGARAAWLGARLIAHDLYQLGINVDCLPIVDVPVPGAHSIIGDRAYGRDPETVTAIGDVVSQGLLDGGVLSVLKHIPGHGRALVDSHEDLPVLDTSLKDLKTQDFPPFKALSHLPMAMTAHVIYEALDREKCATLSQKVISEIIRGKLGFKGLLMSDDLSMHALKGTFDARCHMAIEAGCDVILHCNGHFDEMKLVAEAVPSLENLSKTRADEVMQSFSLPKELDVEAATMEFEALLSATS